MPIQIEIVRPLRIANILDNVAQIRNSVYELAVLGKPRTEFYKGPGPLPRNVLREHLARMPVGECAWIYYGTTYGPKDIQQYKLDIIHKEFTKIPGARRVRTEEVPPDHYFWSRARIAAGEPDLEELAYLGWTPNGAHVGFSPVSPTPGIDALKLFNIAKRRHSEHGIGLFPAFCVGLREMHLIVLLVYDRADPQRELRFMNACVN
jgi:hypothetical protein